MMTNRTRRLELGKMIIDVAKYILTIVAVGGLVSNRIDTAAMMAGLALAGGLMGVGFQMIPPEEIARE